MHLFEKENQKYNQVSRFLLWLCIAYCFKALIDTKVLYTSPDGCSTEFDIYVYMIYIYDVYDVYIYIYIHYFKLCILLGINDSVFKLMM